MRQIWAIRNSADRQMERLSPQLAALKIDRKRMNESQVVRHTARGEAGRREQHM
jgi:hypothetical protein